MFVTCAVLDNLLKVPISDELLKFALEVIEEWNAVSAMLQTLGQLLEVLKSALLRMDVSPVAIKVASYCASSRGVSERATLPSKTENPEVIVQRPSCMLAVARCPQARSR